MTIFDLLFLAAALCTLTALAAGLVLLARRRFRSAMIVFGVLAASLAIYMSAVIAVSLGSPGRALAPGEKVCSDDWCVAVGSIAQSDAGVRAAFIISSRALRASQRENGVLVYVVDGDGRRYDAVHDPSTAPFDSVLAPGEEKQVIVDFSVPVSSGDLELVIIRTSRFPGLFIIGDDSSLFHKPTVYRIRRG